MKKKESKQRQTKNNMEIKMTLDCKGLSCPMPMMKVAKAIKELKNFLNESL